MRYLFTLLFVVVLCTGTSTSLGINQTGGLRAQVGVRVDGEYVEWCMVDVLGPDQVISFTRVLSMTTKEIIDIGTDGSIYLVVGNPQTCEAYQLEQVTADPLADFYADCQCEYVISQENHQVIEIRGSTDQDYTVEFQEVVRRQCSGETTSQVVHRDTLTKTVAFPPTSQLQYGFNFTAAGQYVDKVQLRYYTAGGATNTVVVDLNPATVQTSYPALTLSPADFEYDGSNLAAMATAYNLVLGEAVGTITNFVNALAIGSTLSIFTGLLHEPDFPYVTQPRPGDADYLITSTIPNNLVVLGNPSFGTTTNTSNYAQECEVIFTAEYGSYVVYDPANPLQLQPNLNVSTTLQAGSSSPTAFCSVAPEVCAEVTPNPVTLSSCVSICDTVDVAITSMPIDTCGASTQAHQQYTGTSGTLSAATYASVTLSVTDGTVAVTIDGTTIDYPAGLTASWSATNDCDRLTESFTIDAANGSAIITTLQ